MPKFSRTTVIETIEAFGFTEHAFIDNFVARFSLEDMDPGRPYGINKRKAAIIQGLIAAPEEKGPGRANLIFEIVEHFLDERLPKPHLGRRRHLYEEDRQPEELFPNLVLALKNDGYIIDDGKLRAMIPEEFQIAEIESELEHLL
jgi:hypothetical protein